MLTNHYVDQNSVLISTVVDHGDGTGTLTLFNLDGSVLSTETVNNLPVRIGVPLDQVGALATLLVVEGVTDLASAAAVVRLPEQALIDEALAWSLG
jgi:hypothetical protein